jgi:hypothetical protein
MTSFKYLIYHDKNQCTKENQVHGQFDKDIEKQKCHEYDEMQRTLERYYLGDFCQNKYSGKKVEVSDAAPSNDGVKVTLVTESSEGEVYQSLLQFIECLKEEIKRPRPFSLCLVIKKIL